LLSANENRQASTLAAPFAIAETTANQVVFTSSDAPSRTDANLRAVVEERMPDDKSAVAALLAGDIDVLDRVPPWHIESLRQTQEVRVESYCLPTVHVLIPNLDRPLPAKREFRRALCFGIDRKWIVERVILGGTVMPGFAVVSGPFPLGASLSDPVRYGYNSQMTPRPFEPRLAAILATIAWSHVQKQSGNESSELPAIQELVLAHPSDPVARLACQAIEAQLEREGIPIRLVEFSADALQSGRVDCDLRYAELAMWEPLADARLVVGVGGLAGDARSPYVEAALRRLDEATSWPEVRTRLAEIHEIAHHELPVIPLWQTMNYFAYRSSIRGIGERPVTLYQDVELWQPVTSGSVAAIRPGQ
jgi:ABC-type transport system substrate-binding protein